MVASGGAVRKIGVMKKVLCDVFGVDVHLSVGKEEAAMGAALFAGVQTDFCKI